MIVVGASLGFEHANCIEANAVRLNKLDALRGLGVSLVVAYHTAYRFPPTQGDPFAGGLRVVGNLGVDLFFSLSGFLIGTILSKPQARADITGFFRKRFFRIFPLLVAAILVFAVADVLMRDGQQVGGLWKAIFFLTGYLFPFQGEEAVPFTITWSLSVEVTAYLLMGLLAWGAWGSFRTFLIVIAALSPLVRIWLIFGFGWDQAAIEKFPPVRLDAIALGALASLGVFSRLIDFQRASLLYGLVCVGLIVAFRFAAWFPPFIETVGYSIFGLAAALWVAALAQSNPSDSPLLRAAAAIGVVSYFIYLFHIFVIEALLLADRMLGGVFGFWSAFIVGSAITFVAGLVSWRYFESPLIRFGRARR
jgi:peptidoglycan/LPS O-acetylase OafA/YrhL